MAVDAPALAVTAHVARMSAAICGRRHPRMNLRLPSDPGYEADPIARMNQAARGS